VPLVLDLRIAHDRVGSSVDPSLNGHSKYTNNLDQSLNDAAADKIRKYRADYNNRPPSAVSFMSSIVSTSGRLHSEFVRLLFLQTHRETDRFFAASGVQSAQFDRDQFHFHRAAFLQKLKSKVGLALAKAADLRINLNLDGAPIVSKSHTHPSHSQTSRLLTSSLSLGVPVPRPTQCVRGA
jgi:PIN domain nuclease of toxin-antitoxin system